VLIRKRIDFDILGIWLEFQHHNRLEGL